MTRPRPGLLVVLVFGVAIKQRASTPFHTLLPVPTREVYAAKIQGFLDAGAKTVMFGLPWPDVAQVRRMAHEVMPRWR
jgi:hypothetical protein